jgi:hypothetical protein
MLISVGSCQRHHGHGRRFVISGVANADHESAVLVHVMTFGTIAAQTCEMVAAMHTQLVGTSWQHAGSVSIVDCYATCGAGTVYVRLATVAQAAVVMETSVILRMCTSRSVHVLAFGAPGSITCQSHIANGSAGHHVARAHALLWM